jgi:hypothetical protein
MADLIVIVPSRERPHVVPELVEAFANTVGGDTQLMFAIDDDDPTRGDYLDIAADQAGCIVGPSTTMVQALNNAAALVTSTTYAVAFMGDDHRPRSAGWDVAYLDELRRLGTGLVYGDDLLQSEKLPTQIAMTADIVRAIGYMAPPTLTHMYVDNAWLALGTTLNRITYLPGVVVEHMHPIAGKNDWDDGYARVNATTMYARDKSMFSRWLRDGLPAAVTAIEAIV